MVVKIELYWGHADLSDVKYVELLGVRHEVGAIFIMMRGEDGRYRSPMLSPLVALFPHSSRLQVGSLMDPLGTMNLPLITAIYGAVFRVVKLPVKYFNTYTQEV